MKNMFINNSLKLVVDAVNKGYFPGAVFAVGCRNGVLEQSHYGNRCIVPNKLPVTDNTLFDLASLTKVIATTMLFMLFIEKGIVSMHDKVKDYYQDFTGGLKDDVALFHLLTHTSGLPSYAPLYCICKGYEDAVCYIAGLNQEYTPGAKVVYSDIGFILLGYILEIIGGDRLDRLCRKYIFEPLGMENTCFNPDTANVAATEVDKITGKVIVGQCHDENGRLFNGISGHAGLFSNITDMIKFAGMLINEGSFADKRFISKAAFKTMTRNYTYGHGEDRALGWCIKGERWDSCPAGGDLMSTAAFGHTGFTGTSMWIDIENDKYIILLTNRIHPSRDNTSITRFRRLFHNTVLTSFT